MARRSSAASLGSSLAMLVALAMVNAAGLHCSSSSAATAGDAGPPCGADPLSCPSGTTCWPVDPSADLACIPAVSGSGGGFLDPCEIAIGVAKCSAGLACDVPAQGQSGQCTYYCDATHSCPIGYSCDATRVGGSAGPQIQICRKSVAVDGGPVEPELDASFNGDAWFVLPEGGFTDDAQPIQQ